MAMWGGLSENLKKWVVTGSVTIAVTAGISLTKEDSSAVQWW